MPDRVPRVEVRLLGRPSVTIDGEPAAPPRGAKVWAVLAYLASAERGRSRAEVAQALFSGAEDPLGALRWSLAATRRLLGMPEVLKGDPLRLELPPGATLDVHLVESGAAAALEEPGLGEDLLFGLRFGDCPVFEVWLAGEQRRLRRAGMTLLREAALAANARGEHERTQQWATALVSREPLDEGYHALLIRAHVLAGDRAAAQRQFEMCRDILRAELGVEPGAAVLAAVRAADASGTGSVPTPKLEDVFARLAVAWQSFLSGTIDHAVDLARGAVAMADGCGDDMVRVATRTLLGAMLGMAVRAWDEAVTVLTEAHYLAEQHGWTAEAATTLGVRAGIDMMRADYAGARNLTHRGLALSDDPGASTVNLTPLAATEADEGDLAAALAHIDSALVTAKESGDPVRLIYAAGHAARIQLMAGNVAGAGAAIGGQLATAQSTCLALAPWLMAEMAEVELVLGDLDAAIALATEAGAIASTTDIAYQRALAARVLGLVDAARGDSASAVTRLTGALAQARRTNGEGYTFHWPIAFILDSLATITGDDHWATALRDFADAAGMHDFVQRATGYLHPRPPVSPATR